MCLLILTAIDFFENILISSPHLMKLILRFTPTNLLQFISRNKALLVFRYTYKKVPAYKEFIDERSTAKKDWALIPEINKKNYINKYSIDSRCVNGKIPYRGDIEESAGTSGNPTMWVRSYEEGKRLDKLVNFGLKYTFGKFNNKKRTIFLNCWSLGPWATGVKFSIIARTKALVKSISTNKENVINTIQCFGKNNRYIISGYPPFISEIINFGKEKGLLWNEYDVNIISGGEGFSESWRNYILNILGTAENKIYSAYGASDLEINIGIETDLAIKLKKLVEENPELLKKYFNTDKIPTFIGQYDPFAYYVEVNNHGELIYTYLNPKTVHPRVKYNLMDSGKVINPKEVQNILKEYGITIKDYINLPIVIVFGRSDGTISLDGANIYPSDIQRILYSTDYPEFIESFFIETKVDKENKFSFIINLELRKNFIKIPNDNNLKNLSKLIAEELIKCNPDYKESYENNKESLMPKIKTVQNNEGIFSKKNDKIKKIYYLNANES